MNNKSCKDCYYNDKCPSCEACEDFTPIECDSDDTITEDRRNEYREAWFEYIDND